MVHVIDFMGTTSVTFDGREQTFFTSSFLRLNKFQASNWHRVFYINASAAFCDSTLETSRTAKPQEPVVQIGFLQERMVRFFFICQISCDISCQLVSFSKELHQRKLLSSYKDMVAVVVHMVNTSRSMRSFNKGTSSPLVQFSSFSEDKNDKGDGGGIPVYAFWSISSFEDLAYELVQMFRLELNLKRLLVVELLSISSEEFPVNRVCWLDELYTGEFDDLCTCHLYSNEVGEPVPPKIEGWKSDSPAEQSNCQLDEEVLQVYLTTWLTEVNIDTYRVDEIFATVGEEMHVSLS